MAFSVFVTLLLPLRNKFDKSLIKEIKNNMEAKQQSSKTKWLNNLEKTTKIKCMVDSMSPKNALHLIFFLSYKYFAYINSYHEKHYVKIKTHRV